MMMLRCDKTNAHSQREQGRSVQTPWAGEVDVLDCGGLFEFGDLQPAHKASALLLIELSVHKKREPVLERELCILGVVHLLAQAVGHCAQFHLI
jgi:hypothetical protein